MSASTEPEYDHLFKFLILGGDIDTRAEIKSLFPSGVHPIDGKKIKLQICNTVERNKFYTIGSSNYCGVHGIIVAFDQGRERSTLVDHVTHWLDRINRYAPPDACKLLIVGNIFGHRNPSCNSNLALRIEEIKKLADLRQIPFATVSTDTLTSVMERVIDELVDNVYWKMLKMLESAKSARSYWQALI